jgi:hypothetical protein
VDRLKAGGLGNDTAGVHDDQQAYRAIVETPASRWIIYLMPNLLINK